MGHLRAMHLHMTEEDEDDEFREEGMLGSEDERLRDEEDGREGFSEDGRGLGRLRADAASSKQDLYKEAFQEARWVLPALRAQAAAHPECMHGHVSLCARLMSCQLSAP